MQSTTKLNVRPLHPIGVEILNLNLAAGLGAALFEPLHDLLLRQGLVLIRKQALSDAQFQQFGELFGTPGHLDESDLSELPMYTLLYGAEIPQDVEGRPADETMFISALTAYQELAPELETRLAGMHAVHGSDGKSQDIHRPVLRAHPLTGKCVLFVSEGHVTRIAELPEDESTALLDQLFAHLASGKYVYRHKWKPGDLMIWDHNSIQHKAGSDYKPEQSSCIKRITIKTSSRQSPDVE
jgi:alpha-ketoglutarate-dependent taurine dioxygenase